MDRIFHGSLDSVPNTVALTISSHIDSRTTLQWEFYPLFLESDIFNFIAATVFAATSASADRDSHRSFTTSAEFPERSPTAARQLVEEPVGGEMQRIRVLSADPII